MSGIYLVTTPIGNNKDFTKRAVGYLEESQFIFCEDTRVFKQLAKACGIDVEGKSIDSFHDHSNESKLNRILELAVNSKCAFVSDAGSPIISDPAYPLIKKAIEENIPLFSAGGVCAPIVALELSGLPPIPFHFHGFLARDTGKKNKDFASFGNIYGTHIFFEGVSRVLKTMDELCKMYPQYEFAIARELTKDYESVYRFTGAAFSEVKNSIIEKGEFTILMHNPQKSDNSSTAEVRDLAEKILDMGAKPKLVAKLLSQILDGDAKEFYSILGRNK